jgi:opacity protein-like surface antigen
MRRPLLSSLALSLAAAGLLTTTSPALAAKVNLPDITCTSTSDQVALEINFGERFWTLDLLGGTIHFESNQDDFDKVKRDSKKNFVVTSNSFDAGYDVPPDELDEADGKFTAKLNKNHDKLSFTLTDNTNGLTLFNSSDAEVECTDNL